MNIKKKKINILLDEILVITLIASVLSPHIMKYLSNYYTCFLFVLFHEMSHVLVASFFGKTPLSIRLSLSGSSVSLNNQTQMEFYWIIIFLAGPLSNIMLAYIFVNIPIIFEINIALAIVNMLPIYPLDGYNIIKILSKWYISQEKAKKVLKIISNITLTIILTIGILIVIRYMNFSLLILGIYIFIEKNITWE